MEKIDKIIVPSGPKKNPGSPIIHQILFRKLELELHLTAARDQLKQIDAGLKDARKKLERMDQLRADYDTLNQKAAAIENERLRIEAMIAGMRSLQNLKAAEFVIAGRPETPEFPVSTSKKMLIIEFGGGGVLLSLLLVGLIEACTTGLSSEARAYQLGLATIGVVSAEGKSDRRQQLRGLALRLRQIQAEPGAVFVFSPLSEEGRIDATLDELASLFALRDERVLVLDARVEGRRPDPLKLDGPDPGGARGRSRDSAAAAPWASEVLSISTPPRPPVLGLSDYLTFTTNDLDDVCHPAEGFGVDRLPIGRAEIPADALATHRMAQLFAELRERYSILLVLAPSLAHSVDLQILAAQSHGVVAVVDKAVPVRREVRYTLAELAGLRAPVLGQVVMESNT
jgi:hypothetical protein